MRIQNVTRRAFTRHIRPFVVTRRLRTYHSTSAALAPNPLRRPADKFSSSPVVTPPQRGPPPTTPHIADDDTIFALSTAPGRAAIAIIRISGNACLEVYRALCQTQNDPQPRKALVRTLYHPNSGRSSGSPSSLVLDAASLILYFDAPKSATGEQVLELHIHGGPATIKAVLQAIPVCASSAHRVRYAEPGEFTRRALLNNRLDLTQVEALGDTLAATTEHQRRLAVRGSSNSSLGRQIDDWASKLLHARGELEALIDFSEDQHFDESPQHLVTSVADQVRHLHRRLKLHIANAVRGELLRDGITCSLLGAPNVGKSSLLNRIVGREAAIVSPEAGTTRDVIEVSLDISGYLVRFGDTAGVRTSDGVSTQSISSVEQEGVRRAKNKARQSDLVLVMLAFSSDSATSSSIDLDPQVIETVNELAESGANIMVIVNKLDLKPANQPLEQITTQIHAAMPALKGSAVQYISCHAPESAQYISNAQGENDDAIPSLLFALTSRFESMTSPVPGHDIENDDAGNALGFESLGATQRHRLLLEAASAELQVFLDAVGNEGNGGESGSAAEEVDVVLAAESLRSAAAALGKITGRGYGGDVESVLGVVFEKFCVGK